MLYCIGTLLFSNEKLKQKKSARSEEKICPNFCVCIGKGIKLVPYRGLINSVWSMLYKSQTNQPPVNEKKKLSLFQNMMIRCMVKWKMASCPTQKMKIPGYLCFCLKYHNRKNKKGKLNSKIFWINNFYLAFKTTGNRLWLKGSDFSVDRNFLCDLEEKSYKLSGSANRYVTTSLQHFSGGFVMLK